MDPRAFLLALFDHLKLTSADYTYVRYATDLGFAPTGIMNQIVRGRRPLATKTAKAITTALGLTGREKKYFLTLVDYCRAKDSRERETLFRKLVAIKEEVVATPLERDVLEYFGEWFHPVLREMVGMAGFTSDPNWIAEHLVPRIRPEQARKSLELLERLGFISCETATGRYIQREKTLATPRDVESLGVTRYHQHMIEIGKESLTRIPGEDRSISAIAVRVSPERARKMMDAVYEFQLRMLAEADSEPDGERVYQLNIQLFPVTG